MNISRRDQINSQHQPTPRLEIEGLRWKIHWRCIKGPAFCRNIGHTHHSSFSDKEPLLKTPLRGKAKSAISETGYFGLLNSAAWRILELKLHVRLHVITDAQLENPTKCKSSEAHDSTSLIQFHVIVSSFLIVVKIYKPIGDLKSRSTLYMAFDKRTQILKEKWWFFADDKTRTRTGLI